MVTRLYGRDLPGTEGQIGVVYCLTMDENRLKLTGFTGFDECVCVMGAFIKYVIFFLYNRILRTGSRY